MLRVENIAAHPNQSQLLPLGHDRSRLGRPFSGPMQVAEMKVAEEELDEKRHTRVTRAIRLVKTGETRAAVAKKPDVNGTTVYLWWKRFCDENRWQTINAPAGRVMCSSKIIPAPKLSKVCFAAICDCFCIGHGRHCYRIGDDPTLALIIFLRQPFCSFSGVLHCIANSFDADNFGDFEHGTLPAGAVLVSSLTFLLAKTLPRSYRK